MHSQQKCEVPNCSAKLKCPTSALALLGSKIALKSRKLGSRPAGVTSALARLGAKMCLLLVLAQVWGSQAVQVSNLLLAGEGWFAWAILLSPGHHLHHCPS